MRGGKFDESDAITLTAIVASRLVVEVKSSREDGTDPIWIGVVTLFFHSLAYFNLLATLFIDIVIVCLWTFNRRSIESIIIPPSVFLIFGLLSYFVQLAFGVVIDIFRLDRPINNSNSVSLFLAYSIPQYGFYIAPYLFSLSLRYRSDFFFLRQNRISFLFLSHRKRRPIYASYLGWCSAHANGK